jgi:hypothetical protein
MWVPTYPFLALVMNALARIGLPSGPTVGPLEIVYLGLYQNGTPAPNPTRLMTDLVEATYNGYARQEVVWYPTYQNQSGLQELDGVSQFYQPIDNLNPQNITGFFLASALHGGILLAMQPLPGLGIPLRGPLDALPVMPSFALDPAANYGASIVGP